MKPTTEILARISQNSLANKEEVFTKLYRYLLRPDIYFVAYKNLYANNGAATKGVNEDTADGFSEAKIDSIIKALADETYQPMPVRRTYIQKKNNRKKLRPLGIPTFTDKLVQEVLRMILEAVYEPIFLDVSHGFRPKRSCHTALKQLRREFNGTRWFVEGDIKGCFDNINHAVLVGLLNNKIKDARITKLIYKFLKAGYLEDWQYHKTYSGTPQGGIISPLLANIYLHELDKFVMKLKSEFDTPGVGQITPEYRELHNEIKRLSHRLTKVTGEEREMVLAEYKPKRQKLMTIPCTAQTDKKLKYVRYADDFLIGVIGSKEDAEQVKQEVGCFIREKLHLEMSEEKTLITHGHDFAKFLGYEVTIAKGEYNKKTKTGATRRVNNGKVLLYVPHDKWVKRLLSYNALKIKYDKQNGNKEVWEPVRRTRLLHLDDLEILNQYNAEIRGLYNYYRLANNVTVLNNFYYVMRYSMLKTFAGKYRTRISKIIRKYRQGKDFVVEYPKKNGKVGKVLFYNNGFRRDTKVESGNPDVIARVFENYGRNSLIKRLKASQCEWCGAENVPMEIHHVRKLKDLSGRKQWEIAMIGRKRKTMALCVDCHDKLHAGKLD